MSIKNIILFFAGFLALVTALVHLLVGQMDLVDPLIASNLNSQQIGEWVAVWHMVTIFLFGTSLFLVKVSFSRITNENKLLLQAIGLMYLLMGIPFMLSSMWFGIFAPQWILLCIVGVLIFWELKKVK